MMYGMKTGAQVKILKLKDFWKWHSDEVMLLAPIVIGGVVKIAKMVSKKQIVKQQKDNKERFIYDRSEGHYWELKRPLRNDEWYFISREKGKGKSYAEILSSLGVLK